MKTLRNYRICGHVHDELIIECSNGHDSETISEAMAMITEALDTLILNAEGYECIYDRKS